MNFAFLPEKIKKQITEMAITKSPISIARSSASIEGKSGEGYLVAFCDEILIFSRELGEPNYKNISANLVDIGKLDIKKEGINTFLNLALGDKSYSMKFSSFEEDNLKSILEAWSTISSPQRSVAENSNKKSPNGYDTDAVTLEEPFSSLIGLAAALMYVASVDGDISKEEDYYIIAIMQNNRIILGAGLAYYKSHSFDDLLLELQGISEDEKLCFLANMMELGMKDGILHRSEMNLVKNFANSMDLDETQYDTIKQVLLIKNKISVLST